MTKFNFNDYSLLELNNKFNVTQVGLYPFDDWGKWENRDDEIEAAEALKYSTVYDGIRYYFANPEDLKAFCKMVEGENNKMQEKLDIAVKALKFYSDCKFYFVDDYDCINLLDNGQVALKALAKIKEKEND